MHVFHSWQKCKWEDSASNLGKFEKRPGISSKVVYVKHGLRIRKVRKIHSESSVYAISRPKVRNPARNRHLRTQEEHVNIQYIGHVLRKCFRVKIKNTPQRRWAQEPSFSRSGVGQRPLTCWCLYVFSFWAVLRCWWWSATVSCRPDLVEGPFREASLLKWPSDRFLSWCAAEWTDRNLKENRAFI